MIITQTRVVSKRVTILKFRSCWRGISIETDWTVAGIDLAVGASFSTDFDVEWRKIGRIVSVVEWSFRIW